VARQPRDQIDEVALAKERLRAAGDHLEMRVRKVTRHAALAGVGASFGAGLLLASGRFRALRIARLATLAPSIVAYSKIGKDVLEIIQSFSARRQSSPADDANNPGA
jgi:amino acid permease